MKSSLLFKYLAPVFICLSAWGFRFHSKTEVAFVPPMNLSEYGFFLGDMAAQIPAEGVIPYSLNTPLFSDYAEKLRFVKVPAGKTVTYNSSSVFDFPEGTMLIKTFYYPLDEREPQKGRRLMETRVLVHEVGGWKAYPYIWNEDQTEAALEVAGGRMEVKWTRSDGKKQRLEYVVPNMNECKGCHSYDGEFMPIGPSARQLNGEFAYKEGSENQLVKWQKIGLLTDVPELTAIPRMAVWNDPATGDLDSRARAWLDINFAHCHSEHGPANTSGLFLDIHQPDGSAALGIMKPPVAAGRGAGDSQYDIFPGKPDESILMFRILSDDPGIRMPEIGRKLVHAEGVALIREWIAKME